MLCHTQYLTLPFHSQFRNVDDATVTTEGSKRDYYVALDGVLCIGGEGKTSREQLMVRGLTALV